MSPVWLHLEPRVTFSPFVHRPSELGFILETFGSVLVDVHVAVTGNNPSASCAE